ncbi:hypothetical protein [Cognatilysobacter bugurensis]|uniref:Uncharacterized protein n=1 Tax=Cognatilysobacter bugurensis TaxID=543356 RepID=A0A918STL8_9GAMM|nr:hypothetical protein [Lysobacter bugurensis]GHA70162.1 hypothetical protein GCM10007067_02790 [Lysobacter bugurensis]
MTPRRLFVLAGVTALVIGLVWMLGDEYGNEARALLRAVARAL